MVKSENFTLLLTSSGEECFHIATLVVKIGFDNVTHLVVKNGNFILLLTSSGQEWQETSSGQWQFHTATDI